RDGKHAGDLRGDDRGDGAPLDERTGGNRRLVDGRIFDVAVFHKHAEAARHYEGAARRTQYGNSTFDRPVPAGGGRPGEIGTPDDVGRLRRLAGSRPTP